MLLSMSRFLSLLCYSASAVFITIQNPGFESDGPLSSNSYKGRTISGWKNYDPHNIMDQSVGIQNPTNGVLYDDVTFGNNAPEGNLVAYIEQEDNNEYNKDIGIKQTLTETITADTTYILTAYVGDSAYNCFANEKCFDPTGFPGYSVQLLTSNNVLLAEDNNSQASTMSDGQWSLSTVRVKISAGDPNIGQRFKIRLINKNSDSGGLEVAFDDIKFQAVPDTDAPTAFPTKYPSKKPTAFPTPPGTILCGEMAVGNYNGQTLTFNVNLPSQGDITFDASQSEFTIVAMEAATELNTVLTTDDDHDGIIVLPNTPAANYKFSVDGGSQTDGIYLVKTSCVSYDPTNAPTMDPTLSPIQSPTMAPVVHPTVSPNTDPTASPNADPTTSPSLVSTASPTGTPSEIPSVTPTEQDNTNTSEQEHDDATSGDADPSNNHSVGGVMDDLSVMIGAGAAFSACFCFCTCVVLWKCCKDQKEDQNTDEQMVVQSLGSEKVHGIVSVSNSSNCGSVQRNTNSKPNKEQMEVELFFKKKVQLAQYCSLFIENGYDSMRVVMAIRDKSEVEDIGVTIKAHQTLILSHIKAHASKSQGSGYGPNTLDTNEVEEAEKSDEEYKRQEIEQRMESERKTVRAWFEFNVGLAKYRYHELFIANGYESMKAIQSIKTKSELREIGVNVLGHRALIFAEIERLRTMNMNVNYDAHAYGHNAHVNSNISVNMLPSLPNERHQSGINEQPGEW